MLSIYDTDTLATALAQPIAPDLLQLIEHRWAQAVSSSLQGLTYILVIQPGDEEGELENEIGFRPTVSPIDGARYGQPAFCPYWSWLGDVGPAFELIVTIGDSGFAFIVLIEKGEGVLQALLDMCREYGTGDGLGGAA